MVVAMATSLTALPDRDRTPPPFDGSVGALLDKIATVTPEGKFKSLQIDDPDLSFAEKRQIAVDILTKSPSQFLARFGEFMIAEEDSLDYFDEFARRGDYAVDFYLHEIRDRMKVDGSRRRGGKAILIKNRRYEALKRLVDKGEYFGNCEMKRRNPLMFEQLVGQYMSNREREEMEKIDNADLRFTTILMEHIDRDQEESLRRRQQALDEVEEDESSSDDDEDNRHNASTSAPITDQEKKMLREEFLSNMYQSFLDGNDTEFNYSSVDDNTEYDSVEVKQQDAEDSYFDAEHPKTVTSEVDLATDESMDYDAPIQHFIKHKSNTGNE